MRTFLAMTSIVLTVSVLGAQQPPELVRYAALARVAEAPVAAQYTMSLALENKLVKGAPYSAEVETEAVQTLADGNRIVKRTTGRVYRDSQGRIRREEDQASGQPRITIFDPVADVTYTLDPERKLAFKSNTAVSAIVLKEVQNLTSTRRMVEKAAQANDAAKADAEKVQAAKDAEKVKAAPAEAAGRGGRGAGGGARGGFGAVVGPRARAMAGDLREETLQATTIEGVRAQGTRRTTTIPARAIGNELPINVVSEEWTSPELQVLVMTKHSDPRTGESTYRMRNINRSEPYASLFQVPADYTIRESGFRRQ